MAGGGSGERIFEGWTGAPGFAVGPAFPFGTRRAPVVYRRVDEASVAIELARYRAAVAGARAALASAQGRVMEGALPAEAAILDAYGAMIGDPALAEAVEARVREQRVGVEWAVERVLAELSERLRAAREPYLAERSHDLLFVADCLLRELLGRGQAPVVPSEGEPVVLVAREISPVEVAALAGRRVAGLVTEAGTPTGHTALLARALGLPTVVGVRGVMSEVRAGESVAVEGRAGRVVLRPEPSRVALLRERARQRESRGGRDHAPCRTACGERVVLRANLELPEELGQALAAGAEGVGLYRTEFLLVAGRGWPSEDEQAEIYASLARRGPVVLRTFDLGGDKLPLGGDKLPARFGGALEQNPALGRRAVRWGLAEPELLSAQLRAMLRASEAGPLRVLIPMVSTLAELRAVRALLDAARRDVLAQGRAVAPRVPLGVMVEVPSVAIRAEAFAAETDFFALGTNDLTQYTLAADRGDPALAGLASHHDPAVLALVRRVARAGGAVGRSVYCCGALASDPLGAALLVGLGLRELSLDPSSLPSVREALGRLTLAELERAATEALAAPGADEVVGLLERAFGERLADLLD